MTTLAVNINEWQVETPAFKWRATSAREEEEAAGLVIAGAWLKLW